MTEAAQSADSGLMLDDLDDAALGEWFEGVIGRAVADFPSQVTAWSYGPAAEHIVDLWGDPDSPVWVISIHGGYFAAEYDRTVNEPLARRLSVHGMAVANIEYRRAGSITDPRETVADVDAAIAAVLDRVPTGAAVALIGHSAGGYLALAAAPDPRIDTVIPLAPVTMLRATAATGCDEGALARWIGTAAAEDDPAWTALELGDRSQHSFTEVLHGELDRVVPIRFTHQYCSTHAIDVTVLPGTGHYEFLDPSSAATDAVEQRIRAGAQPRTTR